MPMNFEPLTAAIACWASSPEPKMAPPAPLFVMLTNLQPSPASFSMCALSFLHASLSRVFPSRPPIHATFSGFTFAVRPIIPMLPRLPLPLPLPPQPPPPPPPNRDCNTCITPPPPPPLPLPLPFWAYQMWSGTQPIVARFCKGASRVQSHSHL